MNFDANTLSTLMQLLSAIAPTKKAQSDHTREDGYRDFYSPNNGNTRNGSNAGVQSVFAMQNGLGERTDLFGQPETKAQNVSSSNPMSALLEMMAGKQSGGTDMMSTLMPMLMNMMNTKTKTASAQPSQTNASSDRKEFSDNVAKYDNAQNKKIDNSIYKKTQPLKDKYEPIAFAGYSLISALNKLYCSKNAVH